MSVDSFLKKPMRKTFTLSSLIGGSLGSLWLAVAGGVAAFPHNRQAHSARTEQRYGEVQQWGQEQVLGAAEDKVQEGGAWAGWEGWGRGSVPPTGPQHPLSMAVCWENYSAGVKYW